MAEDNTEIGRYRLSPTTLLLRGVRVAAFLGDVEKLIDGVLTGTAEWKGEWKSLRPYYWLCHIRHQSLDIEFDLICDGSKRQFTRVAMTRPNIGSYHSDLVRALKGDQPHIPELVSPMIEKYGLVLRSDGYKATRNPDDLKYHKRPMKDELDGKAQKFNQIHDSEVNILAAIFVESLTPRMPNEIANALARLPAPKAAQGYRLMFEAPITAERGKSTITDILEECQFGFEPFKPIVVDPSNPMPSRVLSTYVKFALRPRQEPVSLAGIWLRPDDKEFRTRFEVVLPLGEIPASLTVDLLDEIRERLGIDIGEVKIQLLDDGNPTELNGTAADGVSPDTVPPPAGTRKPTRKRARTRSIDPRAVVAKFNADRAAGKVDTLEAWAAREGLTYKTLNRYRAEVEGKTELQD